MVNSFFDRLAYVLCGLVVLAQVAHANRLDGVVGSAEVLAVPELKVILLCGVALILFLMRRRRE